MKKIAVIPPVGKSDYLANTVIDGLIQLAPEVEFKTLGNFPNPFSIEDTILTDAQFTEYAAHADLLVLCWGKESTNYAFAEKIGRWDATIFIDGSELGRDRRYDVEIRKQVEEMTYEGNGAIDRVMLEKCKRYFRRERPYIKGILPLPFGIERRYVTHYDPCVRKDIDFVCIFGQEDYPKMRKEVRKELEKFTRDNGFTAATAKTPGFNFDDTTRRAGRDEFHELLARAKVGVSVGGGGYDTARFWEILGNQCVLLTETIDIDIPEGTAFNPKRVVEFKDVVEFKNKLEELGKMIKTSYTHLYDPSVEKHTTKARVEYILEKSL